MDPPKTLLVLPTYNEKGTIGRLLEEIQNQGLELDLLVIDDHSPDGTGELVESLARRMPRLSLMRRPGKMGLGSAHKAGFRYALSHGYAQVITMDADFSHSPEYLSRMIEKSRRADVVVASRYIPGGGLVGWSAFRRFLTYTAHGLTTHLLGVPYDCTGGFRLYQASLLRRIDYESVRSEGYAFLIEMLFEIRRRGFSIQEIPIVIPLRNIGKSKISRTEVLKAIRTLVRLSARRWRKRPPPVESDAAGSNGNSMDWDRYWMREMDSRQRGVYQIIAKFYRDQIISRSAAHFLSRNFVNADGRRYLHAGCGSGGSDQRLTWAGPRFHFLDLSYTALQLHGRQPLKLQRNYVCGDLFHLPYASHSMDGIFNFGVMEHFSTEQISSIVSEFRRVLKDDGKMVLFWPPDFGLSVLVLRSFLKAANLFRKEPWKLHPDEISRIRSFRWIRELMERHHLRVLQTEFGPRDLFTYVVVVAEKKNGSS